MLTLATTAVHLLTPLPTLRPLQPSPPLILTWSSSNSKRWRFRFNPRRFALVCFCFDSLVPLQLVEAAMTGDVRSLTHSTSQYCSASNTLAHPRYRPPATLFNKGLLCNAQVVNEPWYIGKSRSYLSYTDDHGNSALHLAGPSYMSNCTHTP